jgi:hypothetical protein
VELHLTRTVKVDDLPTCYSAADRERDLDPSKSRRGERMIFEGAGKAARNLQVHTKGRPAST